ncbi:MAG: phosphotransferase [Pseudomonadales bacterium]|nr:phosphotransferase [Pseudomonadales bacterium]
MTFPSQPEQLTTNWLSTALNKQVDDFQVELFGEGAGIIGQVTRVHVSTSAGSETIIAKFPSPSPDNRAVAATYDMYGREVGFYRNVAPSISLRVPDCYHSEYDASSLDFVILMEDLKDMRIGDQVAGCSQADAHMVVEGIAKLAASSWETSADLVSHNNPDQRDGMMGGFNVGWPVVQEQFAHLIPPAALNIGQQVPAAVPGLLETLCTPPISISHADVRLDNIFFGSDEIALVDWQSVCSSAPEQDLAYFVTQSLSDGVRNSEDWIQIYHDHLLSLGVSNYGIDQCRERYVTAALYLVCYATIISGTLDLANERGRALGETLFGNSMRSLTELDAFSLL